MARPIIFGEIPSFEEGHWFKGRKEMMPSSFHRNWGAGIDGNGTDGTSAIVLSDGYEDDEDSGDEIIYTGAGGNDPKTRKQIEDQSWKTPGNAGLLKSMSEGLLVRVIRGYQHKSDYSPKAGYAYAGLYSVVDAWQEGGKSGYQICRFRLVYDGEDGTRKSAEEQEIELSNRKGKRKRKGSTISRVVRDSALSRDVKKLYNGKCQICGFTIKTKGGNYAEGAHIKPLGRPHNGDDSVDNLLCLCPNHHVMLDKGSLAISDDFSLLGEEPGKLDVHPKHHINLDNLKYQRAIRGYA